MNKILTLGFACLLVLSCAGQQPAQQVTQQKEEVAGFDLDGHTCQLDESGCAHIVKICEGIDVGPGQQLLDVILSNDGQLTVAVVDIDTDGTPDGIAVGFKVAVNPDNNCPQYIFETYQFDFGVWQMLQAEMESYNKGEIKEDKSKGV